MYLCVVSVWIFTCAKKSDTSLTPSQDALLGSVLCIQAKLNANQSILSVRMQQEVVANWIYFEFLLLLFY